MAGTEIYMNLAMNQHGQITLPKALRKMMGLEKGDAVRLIVTPRAVTIERAETIEEVLTDLDRKKSARVRAAIRANRGKTVTELREEYVNSAEGRKYYKEKYEVK